MGSPAALRPPTGEEGNDVAAKTDFMQVAESFSGTLEDKRGKEVERTPVTLNKGQVFAAGHRYVKQWPQHFKPLEANGQTVVGGVV